MCSAWSPCLTAKKCLTYEIYSQHSATIAALARVTNIRRSQYLFTSMQEDQTRWILRDKNLQVSTLKEHNTLDSLTCRQGQKRQILIEKSEKSAPVKMTSLAFACSLALDHFKKEPGNGLNRSIGDMTGLGNNYGNCCLTLCLLQCPVQSFSYVWKGVTQTWREVIMQAYKVMGIKQIGWTRYTASVRKYRFLAWTFSKNNDLAG